MSNATKALTGFAIGLGKIYGEDKVKPLEQATNEILIEICDLEKELQAAKDKLKAMSNGFDIMQKAYLDSHTKRVELEDKLKAVESERERTVSGYAEEQLKLLGQITEIEASHKQMVESAQMNKRKLDNFDALEKIARDSVDSLMCVYEYDEHYPEEDHDKVCLKCLPLKKIDELK